MGRPNFLSLWERRKAGVGGPMCPLPTSGEGDEAIAVPSPRLPGTRPGRRVRFFEMKLCARRAGLVVHASCLHGAGELDHWENEQAAARILPARHSLEACATVLVAASPRSATPAGRIHLIELFQRKVVNDAR